MDIYRSYIRPQVGEADLVHVGRWTSFISLVIAVIIAPMLSGLDQAFQYIQEFTGFISPGALAIFLAGFFYRKATANGAYISLTSITPIHIIIAILIYFYCLWW